MDLSHLRDELANPQMDGPPGHRASHPALTAQFKQTAFHLTTFWRSSLRAGENAYHRGYLAALGDVRDMLARLDDQLGEVEAGAAAGSGNRDQQPSSTSSSMLHQRNRLRNYLTARMEAVAEDVKATAPPDASGAGPAYATDAVADGPSSSQTSGSTAQLPSSREPASSPAVRSDRFQPASRSSSSNSTPARTTVPAFISSVSAFSQPLSGSKSFGSGTALGTGSTPSSLWAQDGSNTAARMARLQYGLPHMRGRSAGNAQGDGEPGSEEVTESAIRQNSKAPPGGGDMDTDRSSQAPSSPITRSQATTVAAVAASTAPSSPARRPPPRSHNSLIERVAQAKAARASMASTPPASERPGSAPPQVSNEHASARAHSPARSSAQGTTPIVSSAPLSPLRQVQPTAPGSGPAVDSGFAQPGSADTAPNLFTFTSPPRLLSPANNSPLASVAGAFSPTAANASLFSPPSKTSAALSRLASSKSHSHRARSSQQYQQQHHHSRPDYGSTDDDEEQRSDGPDSDSELTSGPLRMPMIRRRPPSLRSADSDAAGSGAGALAGLGSGVGASLAPSSSGPRPRKRRK
ncbi:hypothetical protein OC834_003092 [Tilletia horrida]|nr:hypothetical protein OC834_003092 [Tilletia horrida]